MKKNNLFKPVSIVILVYILFTWIVPMIYGIFGLEGEVSNQVGIISVFSVILETFSGFGPIILYILLVGGFYGVLKATGAYEAIIERLTDKSKGKEKIVLLTIVILLAIISSIAGLDLGLLFVYPLLIGLIVRLGYDKIVAVTATAGATIVGMYGATLAGTMYGTNNAMLELPKFDAILYKVILFVIGLGALIFLILNYICKNKLGIVKSNKKTPAKKTTKASTKTVTKKTEKPKVNPIPALIVFAVLLVIFVLGTISWETIVKTNAEGLTFFDIAHNAWTGWGIKDFAILNKLFGGIEAFGKWVAPVRRFEIYSILLVIAMFILKSFYKSKKDNIYEGFVDGIKSFVTPTIVAIIAYSVFVFVYRFPTLGVVTSKLLTAKESFNVGLFGLYSVINSIFYVDYYYLAYFTLYGLNSLYTDASTLSIISVMCTSLYSAIMLLAPTSVLLLLTLSISEVKYKDWFKFIWKFVLVLLVVAFAIAMIMLGSTTSLVIGIVVSIIALALFVILNIF